VGEPTLLQRVPGPLEALDLRQVILAVTTLGLLVRIAYWVLLTPRWRPQSDASQYLDIARNVAAGDGFSTVFPQLELHATAFRPPLYPLLLALPTWVFGPDAVWPARLLSILLGMGVIALTVVFVNRIGGLLAAAAAGTAVALYPPLVANDTVALSEPLALVLILGVLITLDQRRPVACGALLGLLVLTRPNAYLVILVVVVVLWRSLGWRRSLLSALVAAAVVAPWMIRNQVQVGSPQITTSDGFTMAAIYGPAAQDRGTFVDPVFDPAYDGTGLRWHQLGPESSWSAELGAIAIDEVLENPGYVLEVVGRNTLAFFELRPSYNDLPESIDGRDMRLRTWALPAFYLVTLAGCVGLWVHRRDRRSWPAMIIGAQFVALSLVLVAPPRLRAPFDVLMCIGVGLLAQDAISPKRREVSSPRSCCSPGWHEP
jgi:hypothetical protein